MGKISPWPRVLPSGFFVFMLLVNGTAIADSLALRYYDDAITRFNSGDSRGALVQLKNSLQRDPAQLPARVLMGQIQLDLGNPVQAEEELLMAAKLGADRALVALPLARARNQLGKHAEIVDGLRPTEYPLAMQADLWAELGKARLANRDRVGAEIAFAEALKLVPYHEESMLAQVRDLVRQNQYAEAAPRATDILSRYPENADAWFLMGSVYHARGEFESSVAHYRRASQLDPNHQQAEMGAALALLDSGKQEQGIARLQEIVAKQPQSLDALYFLAKALKKAGDADQAGAALQRASDIVNSVTPADIDDNTGQLFLAAEVALESGQHEAAYGFLSKYLEYEPQDLRANKQLARLLVQMGKPADASRLLTRLKVSHPRDPQLLVLLGDVKSNLHDYLAAESYYQAALGMVNSSSALDSRVGLTQLRQGQMNAAIDTFQRLDRRDSAENAPASLFLGILYLSNGRLEEAREVADRVVARQPDNLAARNLLAAVAISLGERKNGRRMLEAILAREPAYRPALINLTRLDIVEGDYIAAGDALDRLLRVQPDDQLALREAARLAAAQGNPQSAIQWLERIRQINPRAVRPSLELSTLYLAVGRTAEALRVMLALDREVPNNLMVKEGLAMVQLARDETAVAQSLLADAAGLAGHNPIQLARVARLQIRAGAHGAAEKNLRKAIEVRPEMMSAHVDLAALLARQGLYAEAVDEVSFVLERESDSLAAVSLLGDIRLAQGMAREAEGLYRRAQALSNEPEVMVSLYNALVRAGKSGPALEELRAWNEAHPDNPPVMRMLAHRLHQEGESDAVLRLYLRLAELEPDNAGIHNNLANILLPIDGERALVEALRAYELARDNAAVLDTLGWVLVQLGELERGMVHLREAVVRASRSATIRYHLAVALEEYGNRVEARRELQRALELEGEFPEREQARQRLRQLNRE